jgi:lysophospholipase L1-like esterase
MSDLFAFFALFAAVVLDLKYDPSVLGPSVGIYGDSNVGTGLVAGLARRGALRPNAWDLSVASVSGSGLRNQGFWVPHLRARIERHKPDVVILNLGANDACAYDFGEHFQEMPEQALALLREIPTTTRVVIVGVPPDVHNPMGEACEGAAQWLNLFVWPYAIGKWGGEGRFIQPPAGLLGDPVHYTELGGREVAEMVYDAACELLGEHAYEEQQP